jgi:hypothetical protein
MHPILLLINVFVCISTLPNKGESILQCTHMIDTYTQKEKGGGAYYGWGGAYYG